jgi:hypothetical protein
VNESGENGQGVVDEPVACRRSPKISLDTYDATKECMPDGDQTALDRALERSLVEAEAKQLIDADEVLAELVPRS